MFKERFRINLYCLSRKLLKLVMPVGSFFLAAFLLGTQCWAAPASLTYQGRILKSDGTPLEYSNVSFVFQITDPSGQCVVYQEQVNGINMSNSSGVFDVPIGNGVIQYPLGATATVLDVFNNSGSFTCGGCSSTNGVYTCVNGTSSYSASATDIRKLRVSFYDGSGWKLITPDNVVRSVPYAGYALSAQRLGNNLASDFVTKAGLPSCGAGTFLSWDGTSLTCQGVVGASGGTVTNVTSSNSYLTITSGTTTPQVTLNIGTGINTVAAGNDPRIVNALQSGSVASGDLSGAYPGPMVVAIQGIGLSATTPTSGQVLKFNGTHWAPSVDSAGGGITGLTGDVSATGPGSVASTVNSVGGKTAAAIATSVNDTVAATNLNTNSTIVKRDVSGNFSAGTISANLTGNVTGNVSGNVTGASSLNVLKAGDTMTGNLTFRSNKGNIFIDSGTNSITVQAPTTIVSSYVLKLPTAQGSLNQVLTNDGAGNLLWTTPSTTATSYSGVLPIANGGTNSSTVLSNNRIMVSNAGSIVEAAALTNGQLLIGSTGAAPSAASLTAGTGITITPAAGAITIGTTGLQASSLADGKIWVGQIGTPAEVTPSGDATLTNAGAITVTGIRGKSVSAAAPSSAGQVLRYDGTSTYVPAFLGLADIKASITPFGGSFVNAGCTAGQSLYWQSSTDTFECQSVAINDSQLSYTTSRTANTFLAAPNGSAGAAAFRAIASADLPAGTLSGAGTAGYMPYYSAASVLADSPIYTSSGKVGIGLANPSGRLQVAGNGTGYVRIGSDAGCGWNFAAIFLNDGLENCFNYNFMSGPAPGNSLMINTPGGSNIHFRENNIDTMVIESGGNVGIGTANPNDKLTIAMGGATPQAGISVEASTFSTGGNAQASYFFRVRDVGASSTPFYVRGDGNIGMGTQSPSEKLEVSGKLLLTDGYSATNAAITYKNDTDYLTLSAQSGGTNNGAAIAIAGATNTDTPAGVGSLSFFTTGASPAAVIKADGSVGIGTVTPGYKLDVQGGNVNSAGAYTNVSDIRLKQDVQPLENSLSKILQLQGVSYYWKDQSFDSSKQVGFVAQEVEKIFPEVVKTDSRGFKAMSYSQLVSPVVNAIKELYAKWFEDHQAQQALAHDLAAIKAENAYIKGEAAKYELAKDNEINSLKMENAAIKAYLCEKDPSAEICK